MGGIYMRLKIDRWNIHRSKIDRCAVMGIIQQINQSVSHWGLDTHSP